jgi:hypothetical protein
MDRPSCQAPVTRRSKSVTHAPPNHPACCPVHKRSYTLDGHRVRRGIPELVPDWNRHPRLASKMHYTTAHRLISHTHPTRSPATPPDSWIPHQPHPSFLASKASYGEADRGADVTVRRSSFYFSCSAADSSGMQQSLIRPPRPPRSEWPPSCFSTMGLRPEQTVHTACIYCLVLVLSV